MPAARFDEVYAVSDIHMGGRPGAQIFKYPDRLGSVLSKLAKAGDGEIAFVLNGDVIDSLAESLPGYVAMTEPEIDSMLKDVFANFEKAWDGLATFACTPHRTLVIVIGNHDIELALPQTKQRIEARLAEGNPQGSPNVVWASEGKGFECTVGNRKILCTHGNEYDAWNQVDYDQLGKLATCIENREPFPRRDWEPNAGTRLVVDVMNQVKDRFAFVDLLKPETKPVLAVLLTLKPELLKIPSIGDAAAIGYSYIKGELKQRGLLSTDINGVEQIVDDQKSVEVAQRELFGPRMSAAIERGEKASVEDLLLGLEYEVRAGQRATALVEEESANETLGFVQMLVDRIKRVDKVESLREALLDWISDDEKAYSLRHEDDTYKRIQKDSKRKHDFVIAGHTHLERAIPLDGQRFYYNSGTWIRLLRLPSALLQSRSQWKRVYEVLDQGSLAALDSLRVDYADKKGQPLILDRAAMVHVSTNGKQTVGRLCRVSGTGDDVQWTTIPDTEFRK